MGAQGRTTVDFGAFPGSAQATVDVTGQSGFVVTSEVEAWIEPVATADHSVDEHKVEQIRAVASYRVDGTLTIDAFSTNQTLDRSGAEPVGTFLWGLWTVGWVWN